MSEPLTIREDRLDDADAVWDLHERALRTPTRRVRRGRASGRGPAGNRGQLRRRSLLLGLVGGEIVATSGPQSVDSRTAELRRICVDPEYQRRGYGTRMLETLEARIRERGVDRIVLETNVDLRAARRLYEREGYTETGRTEPAEGVAMVRYEKSV